MTCIVGLVDGERVWIAGDSLCHAGCKRYPPGGEDTKVFRLGDMLMGVTGSSRMIQLLRYVVNIPEHPEGMATFAYLVTELMPAIKQTIVEHDGVKINDSSDGWQILLGYRGGLYEISPDLCVSDFDGYAAVGCGNGFAFGSLYTTDPLTFESIDPPYLNAETRLRLALSAAAEHDIHVAPPFVIESI